MTCKVHFLGTSCMVPSKDRNQIATALEYQGDLFIFDCGEGTQNQIKKMKLPIGKIKKIFISHWHGDHVLGLNGLVQTLTNTDNVHKIEIHGPVNSKKFVKNMLNSTVFDSRIPIDVYEHTPKEGEVVKILENSSYEVYCSKLNHSIPCNAYSFQEKDTYNVDKEKASKLGLEQSPMLARAKMGLPIEVDGKTIQPEEITYLKKGLKISFVFDTRPCIGADIIAKDADHLIMEATFVYATHAHKAEEYDHMSAKETAEIARANNVKHLIITHFSQRYKDIKEIEAEARETFQNTTSTYDLMTLRLR